VELRPISVGVQCGAAAHFCRSPVWSCGLILWQFYVELRPILGQYCVEVRPYSCGILGEDAAYFNGSTVWSCGPSFVAVL
jgi:hypothetical protein